MKYIIFFIPLFLISCSPFGLNFKGYEVLHEDLDVAWHKVAAMQYIDDPDNYWKSPQEFFADGGGDCEDFATALVYLLGTESSIAIIRNGTYSHAIVNYHDVLIEPQTYGRYVVLPENVNTEYLSYAYIIPRATRYGSRNIMN